MARPTTQDPHILEAGRLVRRMRREGQGYERIAAEMGVSVDTVQRWAQYRPERTEKQKANRPPVRESFTLRRRLFAKALTEGKKPTQAALETGCPTLRAAQQFAYMAKRSPEFQEFFLELLDKAGLDEETLAAGLKQCVEATRVAGIAVNKNLGLITDKLVVPDYHVRHQSIRTAFELRKRLNQGDQGHDDAAAPIHLHLTVDQRQRYEELIGGPLSFDIITVTPEKEEQASGETEHLRTVLPVHDRSVDGALGPNSGSIQSADSDPAGDHPGGLRANAPGGG